MHFGISTHLYHDRTLEPGHLASIAAYGFEHIELFATRSHFDYRDRSAVAALAGWLRDTGVTLHSVHAPITTRFGPGDSREGAFSNASAEPARRQAAVDETAAVLQMAGQIPFAILVVHLGVPEAGAVPGDNHRPSAARSAEEICRMAEPFGVKVALEVIPNALSTPSALVTMLERDIDASAAGICLDFGHAFLGGDVPDAIETVSEHLIATHVHDNHRRRDDHLPPYRGGIDWDAALMSMQKIGFDGTYLMELANTGSPESVLDQARRARERFERELSIPG